MSTTKTANDTAEILKGAFTKDDPRLFSLRSLLLGFEITAEEKRVLKQLLSDDNLRAAIKRMLFPSFSSSVPLGSLSDVWGGVEAQIISKDPIFIKQYVGYKTRIIDMMKTAFKLLDDPFSTTAPSLTDFPSVEVDPMQEWLLARNLYISTVDKTCSVINTSVTNSAGIDPKIASANSTK